MVTWPLDKGAVIPARDSGGGTALHVAAERGDQEMMKLLIVKGAETSAVDRLGRTPLHCSAQLRYGEGDEALSRWRSINIYVRWGRTFQPKPAA